MSRRRRPLLPTMPDLRRRGSEGGLSTKRKLRSRVGSLFSPPYTQFGPFLTSTSDLPSVLSLANSSNKNKQAPPLAVDPGHYTSSTPHLPLLLTRSSISVDNELSQMSRSHTNKDLPLPASFFAEDPYYFARNTTTSRTKPGRPSTANSTTSSTKSGSDSHASSSSVIKTHARAPSAAAVSSFNRLANEAIKPGVSSPSSKRRPSTPSSSSLSHPAVSSAQDIATHSTTPIGAPVHADTVLESEKRPTEDQKAKSSMSHMKNPFTLKMDKRHHAYPSSRAPYPRSYDSAAIDHDTSTHIFFKTLCKSLTWHEFPTPPEKVLDLGCGNGVWILDAAKQWPNSQFVGLDLVPLQPNLKLVAPQLESRIKWVTANFLEKLDFPDDYFDFVHIRRIARGVPEDKWPLLLEEVSRILKPDGAIEVIEEDLIFPGGQEPCTCHYPPDKVDAPSSSQNQNQHQPLHHDRHSSQDHNETRHSPPDTPGPMLVSGPGVDEPELYHPSQYYSSPHLNIRDHSRLEQAYNDMHAAKFINLMPISVLTSILAQYFKDVRSHPPLLITFPPPEEEMWSDSGDSAGSSGNEGRRTDGGGTPKCSRPSTAGSTAHPSAPGSPTRSHRPLASLTPLSPASTTTTTSTDDSLFSLSSGRSSFDGDLYTNTAPYMSQPPVGGWHTLHLDVRSLVHPKQPFIMIDRCRMPARTFNPPAASAAAGAGTTGTQPYSMSKLPNPTFELDLQSLTLHLSQSVTEVLECREAIWEFLVEQKRARVKKGGGSSNLPFANNSNSNSMVDREEFDHWISKYEREMRERIGLPNALKKRFDWNTKGLSSSSGGNKRVVGGGGYRKRNRATASRSVNPGSRLKNNSGGQTIEMAPPLDLADEQQQQHGGGVDQQHEVDLLPFSVSSSSLLVVDDAAGASVIGNVTHGYGQAGAANSNQHFGHSSSLSGSTFRPRTGSAPERVATINNDSTGSLLGHDNGSEGHSHSHSRAHSLDEAWEALFSSKGNESGNGVPTGAGQGRDEEEEDEELPRLSRCVRVFVAWNDK